MAPDGESGAPYARIAAELRRQIITGAIGAGERVPSTRQIMRDHGVAMATASRVLALLRQEGLVEAVPGVGTVVSGRSVDPGRPRRAGRHAPAAAAQAGERVPGRPDAEVFLDRVVRRAIEIADAEGMPAATMRRIATDLAVPTVSVHHRVRGREHLVTLMADTVFAGYPVPLRPPAGWRAQLEMLCRTQWAMYRRHPWLAHVVSLTRPLFAPNAMAHTEWAMRAVAGRGLDATTLVHVAAMVGNFVRGTAVNLDREADAVQDTGLTDDEWMHAQRESLAAVLRTGAFPILAGITTRPDVDLNIDTLFEFGLARTLDGISALLDEHAR
ncbi:TetR/AcrR family transcriptional regulator C-terminal domain-containing protein [Plantactinospora sonchi]|uniref:TetR/AcrR family transcriptional regulator C-terminal domain-containing protein n=1 Tax=Plantactinospora sonchi TaxID=1544735 RepID=A0ABU7S1R4_9ACTN